MTSTNSHQPENIAASDVSAVENGTFDTDGSSDLLVRFGQDTDATHRPTKSVTANYGDAFREFDWSYWVTASPVPSSRSTSSRPSQGKTDRGITKMLDAVFLSLNRAQTSRPFFSFSELKASRNDRPIRFAYALETGKKGWRHSHILLGNISRLTPAEVSSLFHEHLFGEVVVKVWMPDKEKGYAFKSLDPSARDHSTAFWDTNVEWNHRCKQEMKLHRRHLLKLVGLNDSSLVLPIDEASPLPTSTSCGRGRLTLAN